jgi:NhaP-type Na+/H+ or K+/H+ antiporter
MVSVAVEFLIVAGIIIFGFISEHFFKVTGVPSFLFLIFIGVLLGPVTNVFPRASLTSALAIFAELTLLIVLFYGGMDTDIASVRAGGGRAFLQVLLYVIPSMVVISIVANLFFHLDFILALIFASMVGGETTAAVIVPLSRSLKLSDSVVTFLTFESAMNSIFSIILFFTLVGAYNTGVANIGQAITTIISTFSIGIVAGLLFSILWIYMLGYFRRDRYTYVFTMGLIFLTYSLSEIVGGSGLLSVLIFGIFLGNFELANRLFAKRQVTQSLQSQLRLFHGEISFLLETLFFVSLGLIFVIDYQQLYLDAAVGLIITAVLLVVRYSATTITTVRSEMASQRSTITMMCAQGLTPATLAIIAVNLQLPQAGLFLNLVTFVIVFTNVVTTVGSVRERRMRHVKEGLDLFSEDEALAAGMVGQGGSPEGSPSS